MFLSQPFKKLLRYGESALLPRSFDLLFKKRVHTTKTLFYLENWKYAYSLLVTF